MAFFVRFSLSIALLAAFFSCSHAQSHLTPTATVHRFTLRSPNHDSGMNFTEMQRYAEYLKHRKPTRRSTALHRRVSFLRVAPESAFMRVADTSTGAGVGSLVYSTTRNVWTVTDDGDPTVITANAPADGVTISENQRLSTGANSKYPVLAVGQCNMGAPTTIGFGSGNVLCLMSTDASGTLPGSVPTLLDNNLFGATQTYAESNIWTVDYTSKTASPTWVNPDGSSVPAHIVVAVTNPNIIFVTGDVAATSAAYGLEFREVSLNFSVLEA